MTFSLNLYLGSRSKSFCKIFIGMNNDVDQKASTDGMQALQRSARE